jgi:hypothetical protein
VDRGAFAERIRLQLAARYRGAHVEVDTARFALHVTGSGLDVTLPLAPLYHAAERKPDKLPALIAGYVASVEHQLTPQPAVTLAPSRLLWCVRNERSLAKLGRSGDLLRVPIGADMTAFAAEELPGSIMRGVPRDEWIAAGMSDDDVQRAASANTAARFELLVTRIAQTDRIPADGWRVASDPLFQGSVLTAPAVLGAFATRAGGDVLLGVPDRSVVLALPAALPSAERFARRVNREWRDAMNPCSRELLITDGHALREVSRKTRLSGPVVLPWLAE